MSGPPPKRSSQRRRRNAPAAGEPTKAEGTAAEMPDPDPEWHPTATRWYEALGSSGQSVFYQASDWALAWVIADHMSREFSPQPHVGKDGDVQWLSFPPKAASVAAWLKASTALMVAEGDRRRLQLELSVPSAADEGEGASVTHLDDVVRRLHGAG